MTPVDTESVNYTQIRQELARHLEQCAKFGKRFKIVRNGKAEAVLLSLTEWEEILETLAVLTNPRLMQQLVDSEQAIKAGKTHSLEDTFKDLLAEG